jgi:hypothetical protein
MKKIISFVHEGRDYQVKVERDTCFIDGVHCHVYEYFPERKIFKRSYMGRRFYAMALITSVEDTAKTALAEFIQIRKEAERAERVWKEFSDVH